MSDTVLINGRQFDITQDPVTGNYSFNVTAGLEVGDVQVDTNALEALIGTTTDTPITITESATGRTLISLIKGIKNLLYNAGNGLLSIFGAGEAHIGQVGGHVFSAVGSFTRPGDTAPYGANEAVMNSTSAPAAISFPSIARTSGGGITICVAKLEKSTNVITNATFRLWLYTDTPASLPNDNAAFAQVWANRMLRIGYIDFTSPIVGTDCVTYYGTFGNNGPIQCKPTATTLYGILQALGAYTPGNAEIFDVRLRGYQE